MLVVPKRARCILIGMKKTVQLNNLSFIFNKCCHRKLFLRLMEPNRVTSRLSFGTKGYWKAIKKAKLHFLHRSDFQVSLGRGLFQTFGFFIVDWIGNFGSPRLPRIHVNATKCQNWSSSIFSFFRSILLWSFFSFTLPPLNRSPLKWGWVVIANETLRYPFWRNKFLKISK